MSQVYLWHTVVSFYKSRHQATKMHFWFNSICFHDRATTLWMIQYDFCMQITDSFKTIGTDTFLLVKIFLCRSLRVWKTMWPFLLLEPIYICTCTFLYNLTFIDFAFLYFAWIYWQSTMWRFLFLDLIHFLVCGSVQNCVVRSMTFLFIKSQGEFLNKRNPIWKCLQQ